METVELELDQAVARMNERYALITVKGDALVLEQTPSAEASTTTPLFELRKITAFRQRHANALVPVPSGKATKLVSVADLWIQHPARRTFDGFDFRPGGTARAGYYNPWRGLALEPREGDARRFWNHVHEVLCSERDDVFEFYRKWWAHAVQKPAELPKVALLLFGTQGCGKGAGIEPLVDLFGPHGLHLNSPDLLVNRFNSYAGWRIAIFADEAAFLRDPRVVNKVKPWITQSTVMLEAKGVDAIAVPNFARWIFATNEEQALRAAEHERRYVVLRASEKRLGDRRYFAALWKHLHNPRTRGAILHDLLSIDLAGFVPWDERPKTPELLDAKIASLDGPAAWLYACLDSGRLLGAPGAVRPSLGGWPSKPVAKPELFALYRGWRDDTDRGRVDAPEQFHQRVRAILGLLRSEEHRPWIDKAAGKRGPRQLRLPDLSEARDRFAKWLGDTIEWGEGADVVAIDDARRARDRELVERF